jgi:aromatic ring-cleaving dioxygenase
MPVPDAPFHAHIYYAASSREAAAALRDELLRAMKQSEVPGLLYVGELRDLNLGPHPSPQFEAHFHASALEQLAPVWKASAMTVLVHPVTLDDLADHTCLAHWYGEPLTLDLSVLDPRGVNQGLARFGKTDF